MAVHTTFINASYIWLECERIATQNWPARAEEQQRRHMQQQEFHSPAAAVPGAESVNK